MMTMRKVFNKILLGAAAVVTSIQASAIDLDTGNAATEVVIPNAVGAIFEVSPTGGDATLVLRFTTMITNAWFDASAPYHPTAVGVYSNLGRRPAEEATPRNINTAVMYASFRVLNSLFPARSGEWRALLVNEGLDPDDASTDLSTPAGIGNVAGWELVAARENDGMNQLGNEGDKIYHQTPYADYTDFEPANTAYELTDPSKWQPRIVSDRTGIFRVQQFVTPQLRNVTPYSYRNPRRFRAPYPSASQVENYGAYVAQANAVLDASANMTDEQKMIAELFDNKIFSLGFSALFAAQSKGLGLIETMQYDFLTNMAAFDTSIAIWKEKERFNAVRPFSAIAHIYGDSPVTAWGGPGEGTVTDIPADQWDSYLGVADHPEYPSATASFCAAHAETSRLYFGSDELGYRVPAPAGSSRVEPGITPATDMTLYFPTWTDLEQRCGDSRFWAGVHFYPSIPAGQDIGHKIARKAFRFFKRKVAGKRTR
ncbi:vanadium-dependent haloperoxidase [Aurantivibrio plasticivorans]